MRPSLVSAYRAEKTDFEVIIITPKKTAGSIIDIKQIDPVESGNILILLHDSLFIDSWLKPFIFVEVYDLYRSGKTFMYCRKQYVLFP
jgi:hypothetical protein